MKIYTKKGDGGETSVLNKGSRKNPGVSKADPLIDAIGSVDEANSYLGIISSKIKSQKSKVKITIQN